MGYTSWLGNKGSISSCTGPSVLYSMLTYMMLCLNDLCMDLTGYGALVPTCALRLGTWTYERADFVLRLEAPRGDCGPEEYSFLREKKSG